MSKKLSKKEQKELETPEEKRQRRLNKKLAKNRKAMEKMGWDEEYRGYTNSDNPFGDEYLLETCVWQKKLEKEGNDKLMGEEIKKMQKIKMIENKRELEKVKQRRQEREMERQQREDEQESIQRNKEAAYFRLWQCQEDSFHLEQAKLRSKIRVEEGRAKPIDLLAQYINNAEDDDHAVQVTEPYNLLNGLSLADIEDLQEDIKVYLELEQGRNADFWRDITLVTEQEAIKLKELHEQQRDRRGGISSAVVGDIEAVFRGKTLQQLTLLQQQIQQKLQGGEGVDVGYWESLSEQLKYHMARQRLRERHEQVLRHKLYKLKQEQCLQNEPLFPVKSFGKKVKDENDEEKKDEEKDKKEDDEEEDDDKAKYSPSKPSSPQPSSSSPQPSSSSEPPPSSSVTKAPKDNQNDDGEDKEEEEEEFSEDELCSREYQQGSYSPQLFKAEQLPADVVCCDWLEEQQRLNFKRKQVLSTGQTERDEEEELMRISGMDDREGALFSVQVPTAPNHHQALWAHKYRPRKPRFFNRVHTGFEWNKYNQTHYDIDNPPPKIVQGYKFNIFYPDLIDKTKAPEYKVIPCADNKDFAILKFTASAPYEDIAFKIVNREWELSSRRGFRCQYNNNILQLWFHFKRFRYRR